MKRFFKFVLPIFVIALSASFCIYANDTDTVTVTLNGNVVDCASYGQQAEIVDGRTLVSLRAIFEALGASVEWNDAERTVTSELGGITVKLTIGDGFLYKNGKATPLDVPARIINGRTMVPARAVAESFGVSVDWDGESRTVILAKDADEEKPQDESEEVSLEKVLDERTHVYGNFSFGMTMKEALECAKGDTHENQVVLNREIYDALFIIDTEDKYGDDDWLITGTYNCEEIELRFKNDILCSVNITLESIKDMGKALDLYSQLVDYFGLDSKISNINPSNPFIQPWWLVGMRKVSDGNLREDGKLIDFPKRAEKFNTIECYFCENDKSDSYYITFEITNEWYSGYALELGENEDIPVRDILDKYTFGSTRQEALDAVKGKIKDYGNRIDIEVEDYDSFADMANNSINILNDHAKENDILGPKFDCDCISLEFEETGLDRIYVCDKIESLNAAQNTLEYIKKHYGDDTAVYYEEKNRYEWKNYEYKSSDEKVVTVNIFAGIAEPEEKEYCCFISIQPARNEGYYTLDKDGRIVGTDFAHAYGKFYFGMTMEQASEVIEGDAEIKSETDRIYIYDKESEFNDEDERITGDINGEEICLVFDNYTKKLCSVRFASGEIPKSLADETVLRAKEYFGETDEESELRCSWILRRIGAKVNLEILDSDNICKCLFSITLADSSIAYE